MFCDRLPPPQCFVIDYPLPNVARDLEQTAYNHIPDLGSATNIVFYPQIPVDCCICKYCHKHYFRFDGVREQKIIMIKIAADVMNHLFKAFSEASGSSSAV